MLLNMFFPNLFALHRLCALLLPELSSFIAAMLFAVHPIHTEAVSITFKSHQLN